MRMVYSETLIDHFERPRHVGRLDGEARDVGTGVAGTRETGGVLRLQLRVDENGQVTDTRFQAFGPPALIAAGSWLAERLQGENLAQVETLSHQPVATALGLPSARLHFAMLAEDAVRAAIQDYKDKQKVYA